MKTISSVFFTLIFVFSFIPSLSQDALSPYYKVTSSTEQIDALSDQIKSTLINKGFEIIGEYNPENKKDFTVIAYTRKDLQDLSLKFEDRGLLASVLKVSVINKGNRNEVSMINPDYVFNAYFREEITENLGALKKISNEAKEAMKMFGSSLEGFGGELKVKELHNYHYMFGMPYFDDPVELREFDSFEEAVRIIRSNLNKKVGQTVKVYEVSRPDKSIAVFGVALHDQEMGEASFLPTIGEDHIAAMPYEIIVQGNEATMLHGRYRFALYWPELTMGTFTQIMSTPGDVEDMLKAVTRDD